MLYVVFAQGIDRTTGSECDLSETRKECSKRKWPMTVCDGWLVRRHYIEYHIEIGSSNILTNFNVNRLIDWPSFFHWFLFGFTKYGFSCNTNPSKQTNRTLPKQWQNEIPNFNTV